MSDSLLQLFALLDDKQRQIKELQSQADALIEKIRRRTVTKLPSHQEMTIALDRAKGLKIAEIAVMRGKSKQYVSACIQRCAPFVAEGFLKMNKRSTYSNVDFERLNGVSQHEST